MNKVTDDEKPKTVLVPVEEFFCVDGEETTKAKYLANEALIAKKTNKSASRGIIYEERPVDEVE